MSFGASLLGAFMGRKTISATNIGRASTAARSVGRTMKERQDVGRAEENVSVLEQQLGDLEAEFKAETERLAERMDPAREQLERTALRPKKTNIAVNLFGLAWVPAWRDASGQLTPAWE